MPKPTYVVLAVKDDQSYNSGQIHHVAYAGSSRDQAIRSANPGLWVLEERNQYTTGNRVDYAHLFTMDTLFRTHFVKWLIKNGEVL